MLSTRLEKLEGDCGLLREIFLSLKMFNEAKFSEIEFSKDKITLVLTKETSEGIETTLVPFSIDRSRQAVLDTLNVLVGLSGYTNSPKSDKNGMTSVNEVMSDIFELLHSNEDGFKFNKISFSEDTIDVYFIKHCSSCTLNNLLRYDKKCSKPNTVIDVLSILTDIRKPAKM